MSNFSRVFFIFLAVVLTQCTYESQNTQEEIKLAVISSLERLIPGNAIKGKSTADIKAAKNEFEAFQLIISAGDNIKLEDVMIEITDLSGVNSIIGKENFELFRAENIHLRKSSPRAISLLNSQNNNPITNWFLVLSAVRLSRPNSCTVDRVRWVTGAFTTLYPSRLPSPSGSSM